MDSRIQEGYKWKKKKMTLMRYIQTGQKKGRKFFKDKFQQSNETYECILIDINKFSSFSEFYLKYKMFKY